VKIIPLFLYLAAVALVLSLPAAAQPYCPYCSPTGYIPSPEGPGDRGCRACGPLRRSAARAARAAHGRSAWGGSPSLLCGDCAEAPAVEVARVANRLVALLTGLCR
jgi:hypothetical protein